jgi:hypothetical protein
MVNHLSFLWKFSCIGGEAMRLLQFDLRVVGDGCLFNVVSIGVLLEFGCIVSV